MKECTQCKQTKELNEFYKCTYTKGGKRSKCKKCISHNNMSRAKMKVFLNLK